MISSRPSRGSASFYRTVFNALPSFSPYCIIRRHYIALLATSAAAFAPQQNAAFVTKLGAIAEVDSVGNNIAVRDLLVDIEKAKLLSQVAESGLLSKAQAAGVSLSNLEPLLSLAAQNKDVLILVEASGPELLPLLPTLVKLAPPALPLLGAAIGIPPAAIQAAGLASLLTAVGAVVIIPDDTLVNVAAQTLAAGVLGVAVPAASFIVAGILGQLTK
jgi:hypothetical protein